MVQHERSAQVGGPAETIFAVATAAGRAALSVVRLSGPRSGDVLDLVTGAPRPSPRRASLRRLRRPDTGEVLDQALVLWFPAASSATGEDVAELQLHGGRAVLRGVLGLLGEIPWVRPAEAGEFTRRAVLNGRLDLTGAEGLLDLIDADTEVQRRQALRHLDGGLRTLRDGGAAALVRALAHVEASIDFSDEPLPGGLEDAAAESVTTTLSAIRSFLDDGRRGERLRDGLRMTIVGAPNVGKSSLLNWLARRDVAIVAETAGTTRDVLEVALDLGGVPVLVADTAGLRDSAETVEVEGMRRARQRAANADIVVHMTDTTMEGGAADGIAVAADAARIQVVNKIDLAPGWVGDHGAVGISVKDGTGLDRLLGRLTETAASMVGRGETVMVTRARHRIGLEACAGHLAEVVELRKGGAPVEIVAEALRLAVQALGRITGRVDIEDLLDVVFRDFCIGK